MIFTHIQPSQKRTLGTSSKYFRSTSVVVAYYLNKLGVTPQQVLLSRVFVLGGVSTYLLYLDNYVLNLVGLFTLFLCRFFDMVDGDLARNHGMASKLGKFLDGNFDAVVLNTVIFAFTLRFINNYYDFIYVLGAVGALFGTIFSTRMSLMFENQFDINCIEGSNEMEAYLKENKLDALSNFYYNLIAPKSLLWTLLSQFKYFLVVGVIFDIVHITLLLFAIAINIRWISLFTMVALYYKSLDAGHSRVAIYNIMKKVER